MDIVVIRDSEKKQFKVTLRNKHGDTEIVRDINSALGAEFVEVGEKEKEKLEISSGIKIKNLGKGKLQELGIKEGFIITNVNGKPVFEVTDFKREIDNAKGRIMVEGIYPNGEQEYFVFGVK